MLETENGIRYQAYYSLAKPPKRHQRKRNEVLLSAIQIQGQRKG